MKIYRAGSRYFVNKRAAVAHARKNGLKVKLVKAQDTNVYMSIYEAMAAIGADDYRRIFDKNNRLTQYRLVKRIGDFEASAVCKRYTGSDGKSFFVCDKMEF